MGAFDFALGSHLDGAGQLAAVCNGEWATIGNAEHPVGKSFQGFGLICPSGWLTPR